MISRKNYYYLIKNSNFINIIKLIYNLFVNLFNFIINKKIIKNFVCLFFEFF